MIQRIQTVYLLGTLALVVLCFFFPMVEFSTTAGQFDHYTLNGLAKTTAGKSFSELVMFISGVL